MATQNCCGPDGACNDGDPCSDDDHCNGNPNYCPLEPAFTCCGRLKNCDDGKVCTWDWCDPATGSCKNDPSCSGGRKCCPVGSSNFCCNAGEEVCCPSNPGYADHCCPPERPTCCDAGCCLSTQTCCPGGTECCNPDQTCCNGHCGLKGACCFLDTSCSELIETCCAQQGGTYQGDGTTCTPADLCRPKCENCHTVSTTFYECGHYLDNPLGPCAQDECFANVMETASCDSFPYRKGPRRCDTYEIAGDPPPPEVVSKSYWLSIPEICETTNPGGFHVWRELYSGCGTVCDLNPNPPSGVRCDTGPCGGEYFPGGDEKRGKKKACGCP